MAVKIRLMRLGKKGHPSYRLVAADARMPRDGRFLEIIGHYHPVGGEDLHIDEEKALRWLKEGAQPTQKVKDLLRYTGIWKKFQERESMEVTR